MGRPRVSGDARYARRSIKVRCPECGEIIDCGRPWYQQWLLERDMVSLAWFIIIVVAILTGAC